MASIEEPKDVRIPHNIYSNWKWTRLDDKEVSGEYSEKYKIIEYVRTGNLWERIEDIKDSNTIQWQLKGSLC